MTSQIEHAQLFKKLHVKGDPLILYNAWDAGSAKAIKEAGAKAVATGSWSVAAAHGFTDGEALSLELALANLQRIVAAVNLPVSIDFEGGYAENPADVAANVVQAIEAGAIGINFEDQVVGGEGLHSIEAQSARIQAIRQAADATGVPLFINARSDVFLKARVADHNEEHLADAIQRANAYAGAGADGFFAPGLADEGLIEKLCAASPLPVNIMYLPYVPATKRLAELGVARLSYGPKPYRQMMEALKEAAQQAFAWE
jgi:2-methylisocitrate lyase-like PEP mutase family enzyme